MSRDVAGERRLSAESTNSVNSTELTFESQRQLSGYVGVLVLPASSGPCSLQLGCRFCFPEPTLASKFIW